MKTIVFEQGIELQVTDSVIKGLKDSLDSNRNGFLTVLNVDEVICIINIQKILYIK